MRKYIATLLAALLLTPGVMAEVNYQVVPLPQKIEPDPQGRKTLLVRGQEVAYPAGNARMERNARFAQEFLGLKPQLMKGKRREAPVCLTLGLQSENPDAYQITVDKRGVLIQGASESGVFYGIQTLRKSIAAEQGDSIELPWATIAAQPRFQYRGAMLDCSRHFFSTTFTKKFIDILALHGINQFHWHLTDDQGWRPEIKALPELEKASYRSCTVIGRNIGLHEPGGSLICDDTPVKGFYTQDELRDIVAYAAERYINIIPEIDLPGHMVAALSVYPELGCTGGPYPIRPYYTIDPDVLCAGNPKTLEFLKTVLGEICDVFPSRYIHIGGDETPRTNWKKCQKCQALMKKLGLKEEAQLQSYINREVGKFLAGRGREMIGWDEVLEGGLAENAIVMSWRGYSGGIQAARQHHRVIMTPTDNCYFDYYQLGDREAQPVSIGGYLPLSRVYAMEPIPGELNEEEARYILGAQCNLWSEDMASPDHVMYMLLPRLAALCEVQWCQPAQKDFKAFTERLPQLQKLYRTAGYKYCTKYE